MKNTLKALLVVGGFLAMTNAALAKTPELCQSAYRTAEAVMTQRQNGVPLPTMMKHVDSPQFKNTRDLLLKIVVAAYEVPMVSAPENKKKVAETLATKTMLDCMKVIK
jgi:hypothetical protein